MQYTALHPFLEASLAEDDMVSLDAGFWGVDHYILAPTRTYQLDLPPNPSTSTYR